MLCWFELWIQVSNREGDKKDLQCICCEDFFEVECEHIDAFEDRFIFFALSAQEAKRERGSVEEVLLLKKCIFRFFFFFYLCFLHKGKTK